MTLSEMSKVNFIEGCRALAAEIKSIRVFLPWFHKMKISSMYRSHKSGLIG